MKDSLSGKKAAGVQIRISPSEGCDVLRAQSTLVPQRYCQGRRVELAAPGQGVEAGTSRIKERISASWSGVSVVPCARWAWVATWRRSS